MSRAKLTNDDTERYMYLKRVSICTFAPVTQALFFVTPELVKKKKYLLTVPPDQKKQLRRCGSRRVGGRKGQGTR